jgi:hypothetical protein
VALRTPLDLLNERRLPDPTPRQDLPAVVTARASEYAPTRVPDCLILGAKQAFTGEVLMDDPNDPYSRDNLSWNWSFGGPKWRPFSGRIFRGPRVPPPPGPPRKPSKAEHDWQKRAEARAERLHLAGLSNAGVIIMGVVLGVAVIALVLVLVSRH